MRDIVSFANPVTNAPITGSDDVCLLSYPIQRPPLAVSLDISKHGFQPVLTQTWTQCWLVGLWEWLLMWSSVAYLCKVVLMLQDSTEWPVLFCDQWNFWCLLLVIFNYITSNPYIGLFNLPMFSFCQIVFWISSWLFVFVQCIPNIFNCTWITSIVPYLVCGPTFYHFQHCKWRKLGAVQSLCNFETMPNFTVDAAHG